MTETIPDFNPPTSVPVLPTVVSSQKLKELLAHLKRIFPNISFLKKHRQKRQRFAGRYHTQVDNEIKRSNARLRKWKLLFEEAKALEIWDGARNQLEYELEVIFFRLIYYHTILDKHLYLR